MHGDTQAWLDQQDAHLADRVRKCGWSIEYVGGEACCAPGCGGEESGEPPFAHTVGLFGMAHPELLIFDVPISTAAGVLNTLGERVRAGDPVVEGQLIELDGWSRRIIPEAVPNAGAIALGSNRYYHRPPEASVPLLQLSYDDENGRFPWEEGYLPRLRQPRPGTFQA